MQEKNYTGIIPRQESGAAIDVTSHAAFQTTEDAKIFFQEARRRLLHINDWHKIAGNLSATFHLTDSDGKEIEGAAREGCYVKIDIPGPGTAAGMGYDWVIIESVESISTTGIDSIGIRVRPVSNPMNNKQEVAHFYSAESTSTFTVTREHNKVTAAIYDRNTKTNTEASAVTDKIRDAIVGIGGIATFSKLQWKLLTEGLVKLP